MVKSRQIFEQIKHARQRLADNARAEALRIYESIAEQGASDLAAQTELGHLCLDLELYDRAVNHYRTAVHLAPDDANQLAFLGIGLEKFGEPDEAMEVLHEALEINDTMPVAQNMLGVLYMRRSQYENARPYLEKSDELRPGNHAIQSNLANVLAQLNEYEAALSYAKKATRSKEAGDDAHMVLGRILSELGRTDEAIRHFEQIIKGNKTFGTAYFMLSSLKKFSAADKSFIAKTEKVLERSMPAPHRKSIHFALGKMYDDCKEYDKAFSHYQKGNILHRVPLWDLDVLQWRTGVFRDVFTRRGVKKFRKQGSSSAQPVFVVGMPRSGTTLVEQMIASHARGGGAGELPEIPRIATELVPGKKKRGSKKQLREGLTPEAQAEYVRGYLEILQSGHEDVDRIVDKMPANSLYLGLIDALFPNATIIHVIRHPLDICMSCYTQQFKFLEWSNQFSTIADMYTLYRQMMAYWHKVLPEGRIVDVHYEQLTGDPEGEGARMLDACGLEWDDNVLRFYEQNHAVKTASLSQVRQPIYQSSQRRWARYAPYLGEIATRLAPYLPEDREELESRGVPLGRGFGLRRWLGARGRRPGGGYPT
jgi:tetratricopeptide (TPR) repeat protein